MVVGEVLHQQLVNLYFYSGNSWENTPDDPCCNSVPEYTMLALGVVRCKCRTSCFLVLANNPLVADMEAHLLLSFLSCHYSHLKPWD